MTRGILSNDESSDHFVDANKMATAPDSFRESASSCNRKILDY